MTACVLISPDLGGPAPVLVSDTIISMEGKPELSVAIGRIPRGEAAYWTAVRLARKSYIVSEQCAVAVAGFEDSIRDFLEFIRPTLLLAADGSRPMRAVGDRAKEYGGKVSVVGAFVSDDTRLNYVRPEEHDAEQVGILGVCVAIGSGADELIDLVKHTEARFSRESGGAKAARVAADILNQERILLETYSFPHKYDESWGGFLEHVYYDRAEKQWKRQGRTLCLSLEVDFKQDRPQSWNLIDRVVCYDPEPGQIICIYDYPEMKIDRYILDDLISETPAAAEENVWQEWRPERVLVTVVCREPDKMTRSFYSYDVSDQDQDMVALKREGERANFELSLSRAKIWGFVEDVARMRNNKRRIALQGAAAT